VYVDETDRPTAQKESVLYSRTGTIMFNRHEISVGIIQTICVTLLFHRMPTGREQQPCCQAGRIKRMKFLRAAVKYAHK
jgi:hypothetical protein